MILTTFDIGNREGFTARLGGQSMRFGDAIAMLHDDSSASRGATGIHETARYQSVGADELYVVAQKGRLFQKEHPGIGVLLDSGRYLLVQIPDHSQVEEIAAHVEPCFSIMPWSPGTEVFVNRSMVRARGGGREWVSDLVDKVSVTVFEPLLRHLVSYRTRHSLLPEFEQAATWAKQQLESSGFSVSLEPIDVNGSASKNVVARKDGTESGGEIVCVVAHLDSVNGVGGQNADAPGADDNASGSAGALVIAKALANHQSANELRIILFGGEEQGLHGSKQYVDQLTTEERGRILAVLNMDMIGSKNTSSAQVLLEGAAISQAMIDGLAESADQFTSLHVQTSINPFASDHVPFLNAGVPAVLTIEGADSTNQSIHTAADTLEKIDVHFAVEILKMNVGYLASVLGGTSDTVRTSACRVEQQVSGKFKYTGSSDRNDNRRDLSLAGAYRTRNEARRRSHGEASVFDAEPMFVADKAEFAARRSMIEIILHVDVDGADPLNVVSGTVQKGMLLPGENPAHFVGRVTSDSMSGSDRILSVQDFTLRWPDGGQYNEAIVRLRDGSPPTASIQFNDSAAGIQMGPYNAVRTSKFFREVEFDYDREEGAINVISYDTHTHPDRPSDLTRETLTLESTFAKSGIGVSFSSDSGTVVSTSEAGDNARWNYQELHDSMSHHWDSFANSAQWKMWLFAAKLADSDTLGGVMFDGDIDEQGGVDRQGTALFTKSPWFHSEDGGYITANPPTAEAVKRELFFNLIHETGHAFNLAHSFQKELGEPWMAPEWMPLAQDSQALSWMNYPDSASPGLNASWFYNRFRFKFDDNENLFLRHAPERFVQMGNEAWSKNHGRVSRESLNPSIELLVRTQTPVLRIGQPLHVEFRLRNRSDEPIMVHDELALSEGFVRVAITDPAGNRTPFVPISRARCYPAPKILKKDERSYHAESLTMGRFGFPFKIPGTYRIEAAFHNLDGSTAVDVLQVIVSPPAHEEELSVASELFNARVGRAINFDGTRVMEDVRDKLDWAIDKLPNQHPSLLALITTQATPYAQEQKLVEAGASKVKLLPADPEQIYKRMKSVVESGAETANALGHIGYHKAVDEFTLCSVAVNKKVDARKAQEQMLAVFKKRGVVQPVIREVEKHVEELKKASRSPAKKPATKKTATTRSSKQSRKAKK